MTHSKKESSFFIKPLAPIDPPLPIRFLRDPYLSTLNRMNNDIEKLNDLITEYNQADNRKDQIQKLKQLDAARQRIDDEYTDEQVAYFPDYQRKIYTFLQQAIVAQRALFHINSNYETRGIFEPDSGRELSDVMDTMPTEDVAQIMEVLAVKKPKNVRQQLAKIAPMNRAYQDFLIQHDIEFIGGRNSKNFVFVNRISQQRILLKLENSMDHSKKPERELRTALNSQENEAGFLVRHWSDRRAAFADPETSELIMRRLTVMDYSPGRGLNDIPVETDMAAQQNLMVDTALAQIMIYKQMHLLGKIWTDGKGSNILFHRDPNTQVMVAEIADCKAICDCDPMSDTFTNSMSVLYTPYITAPELESDESNIVDIDKAAVYTIGKNLYESLLRFVPNAHRNYNTLNKKGRYPYAVVELPDAYFKHEIFAEPFKSLIQSMTRADPAARISNDELFSQLLNIKFAQHPEHAQYQQACQKIEQILAFDLTVEEKQQRNEFVFKCYQTLLNPTPDLDKLNKRLERVIQKYQERPTTTIYKEALGSQKKDGSQVHKTRGLDAD